MINKKKINKMLTQVKETCYVLGKKLKEIYNEESFTQNEMSAMIDDDPSVETFFKMNQYVIQHCKDYDENSSFFLCDVANFDDSESYKIRDNVLKNIFSKLGLPGTIVYRNSEEYNGHLYSIYYFTISRGRNGSGDFVNIDMKEIADIVNIMRDNGATSATPIDVFIDCPDDLSDWVIAFKIDEEKS